MPEDTIHKSVLQTSEWVNSKLQEISRIETEAFRKILYYSLIDSFVQTWKGYSSNTGAKEFGSFLVTFSDEYRDVLQKVCPVTLYHHYSDKFAFGKLRLSCGALLLADSEEAQKESDRLLMLITDEKERKRAYDKHQYCRLMYAERSKLVHELTPIGMPIDFDEPLPHMVLGGRPLNGTPADDSWQLKIPEKFVILVLQDTINGYLRYCEQNGIAPFKNNARNRKCRSAWYD